MLRLLKEEDRKIAMEFLGEEPAINLFILGDIENYGFDVDFQKIWGSFNKRRELVGVLLKYNDSYIPYIKEYIDEDIKEMKKIILQNDKVKIISGKDTVVENFVDVFKNSKIRKTYFCELREINIEKADTEDVRIAVVGDGERLSNLLNSIDEFDNITDSRAEIIDREIESGSGRAFFIEDEKGKVVSMCETSAENSKSAMVIGVCTDKSYRGKGLVKKCLNKMAYTLIEEGKTLCLFYENHTAGKIYLEMGFKEIGMWTMINKI